MDSKALLGDFLTIKFSIMSYLYKKIGSKVKEYKGVQIYVNSDGVFYADAKDNSADFNKNTFQSAKITAIETAIDSFKNVIDGGKEFYDIVPSNLIFKKIKVVANVGNLLFFDDGTDTKNWRRKKLYPVDVENFIHFESVKSDIEKAKEIDLQIAELYKTKRALIDAAQNKMMMTNMISPSTWALFIIFIFFFLVSLNWGFPAFDRLGIIGGKAGLSDWFSTFFDLPENNLTICQK